MGDWWNGGPANKARKVYAEEPREDWKREVGYRLRNQQKRADELLHAEQRAQDAQARAPVAERRLEEIKRRLDAVEVDLECSKQTNRKLFRNYESVVEEKQSLKRENEKLLDLVQTLKRRSEKSDSSSSAPSSSDERSPR